MQISDEQKTAVAGWIQEGASLSDVQKRLESEHGLRLTYMDVRFLVDDLDLELKAEGPHFEDPKLDATPAGGTGEVSVTLDKVARPDALVSGQVTFSDGQTALWHLDQMGRLALNPKDPGYKPSQEDVQSFQDKLRDAVEKSGMF